MVSPGRTANPSDVLMISQYYRPEPIGSGPFCADLAEALAAGGRRVDVFTTRPHYPHSTVYKAYRDGSRDEQVLNDVRIARVPTYLKPGGSPVDRLLHDMSFVLKSIAAIRRGKSGDANVIVALCPSVFATLLATLLKRRNARCVALIHDIQSGLAEGLGMIGGGIGGTLRRLERFTFNRCDLLIVLSEEMRNRLVGLGVTRPIHVHPIWIDTDAIAPEPPVQRPDCVALYSGNLGRKQGLMQLVDAAAALADRGAAIRMRLRGNGGERDRLEAEIQGRGLDNIELCDLLPPNRLSAGLADGDIHLVPQDPSTADYAVPSKIYGIMAAGRPFIATAGPGSTLWRLEAETEAFICVPPNDPDALADAMMSLAASPERRRDLGARARAYVLDNCAKHDSLRRLIDVIYDTAG